MMMTTTHSSIEPAPRREVSPDKRKAVLAAIEAIASKNVRPTVKRIRAVMGGSPNDILPVLQDWWKDQVTSLDQSYPRSLRTESNPDPFLRFARELWVVAVSQARLEALRDKDEVVRAAVADGQNDILRQQLLTVEKRVASLQEAGLRDRDLLVRYDARDRQNAEHVAQLESFLAEKEAELKSALQKCADLEIRLSRVQASRPQSINPQVARGMRRTAIKHAKSASGQGARSRKRDAVAAKKKRAVRRGKSKSS